jgi:hypothetical protein
MKREEMLVETRSECNILIGKPGGSSPWGGIDVETEDIIEMDLGEL